MSLLQRDYYPRDAFSSANNAELKTQWSGLRCDLVDQGLSLVPCSLLLYVN